MWKFELDGVEIRRQNDKPKRCIKIGDVSYPPNHARFENTRPAGFGGNSEAAEFSKMGIYNYIATQAQINEYYNGTKSYYGL